MLRVYFGNDTITVRQKAFAYVEELQSEGAGLEAIDSDNFQPGILADAIGGASLFGSKTIYVIDTPSSETEMYEDVVSQLPQLAESPNLFVIIEKSLLAAEKKKFQKHADIMEEFKAEAALRFNTFALADALARRDKRSLWLIFNEARLGGIALEEISGILWWQLKTMHLAALTDSADEAGIKEYPYNKAKRALQKFRSGELEHLSHALITLQHESRLGLCEFDIALERWVLTI